ncbi:MAG: hypothetical protein ACHQQQ_01790 [Bacteroidota bacterium]
MREIIDGLKEGFQFTVTFHPHLELDKVLLGTSGLSNFLILMTLGGLIAAIYFSVEQSKIIESVPFGKPGFVTALACLALAWSGLASIALTFFYIIGSLTGCLIGVRNGTLLRRNIFFGVSMLAGIFIGGILIVLAPINLGKTVQLIILCWLAWDMVQEGLRTINMERFYHLYIFLMIGGAISLVFFDPKIYCLLIVKASETTSMRIVYTDGFKNLMIAFSYTPILGWVIGFWNEKPY